MERNRKVGNRIRRSEPMNQLWKDFSLNLKGIMRLESEEWEAFLKKMIDESNSFFGME